MLKDGIDLVFLHDNEPVKIKVYVKRLSLGDKALILYLDLFFSLSPTFDASQHSYIHSDLYANFVLLFNILIY